MGASLVDPAVDKHIEVAGQTLPRAHGVRRAVAEVPVVETVPRKVVVALDDDRVITLGEYDAIPHGFRHQRLNSLRPSGCVRGNRRRTRVIPN